MTKRGAALALAVCFDRCHTDGCTLVRLMLFVFEISSCHCDMAAAEVLRVDIKCVHPPKAVRLLYCVRKPKQVSAYI